MTAINAFEQLRENTERDPAVGIAIAALLESEGVSFYATELLPSKKITPHYHKNGEEIYIILQGKGVMHTFSNIDGISKAQPVKAGDVFKVLPHVTHQLENNSDSNLILLFACPPNHLLEDRFIAETVMV